MVKYRGNNKLPLVPGMPPDAATAVNIASLPLLRRLARRYIWWKEADSALKYPHLVIAQVMDIGTFEDACELLDAIGEDEFRKVLDHAEAGMFSPRSWHYWQYRLGKAERPEQIAQLPQRNFR